MSRGSQILSSLIQKAIDLREQDNLIQSLYLFDQVTVESIDQKNYSILIDALHGKVLTWKHFYLLKNDPQYKILAQNTAQSALKICQDQKISQKLSVCYFRIAEMDMLFKDYSSAAKNYEKALELYGLENAEKGDYIYHLGEAIFRSGDQLKGEEIMLKGLKIIKEYQDQTDSFLINVWMSGCFLRLAELILKDDLQKAQNYFHQAKEIIDTDTRLVIRKRQMQALDSQLN